MEETLAALGLGAAVGLGVAMPLGAIGVLLLQAGMVHGWRRAAAGGAGAALVDTAYAGAAVLVGAGVGAVLAGHEGTVRVLAGAVLASIALHGVRQVLRGEGAAVTALPATPAMAPSASGSAAAAAPVRGLAAPQAPTSAGMLLRFVALTAVNPLTVLYFTVVAAGLAERLAGPAPRVAFVLGIGLASALWQLGLVATGAVVGARVCPGLRRLLVLLGHGVVLVLAGALVVA